MLLMSKRYFLNKFIPFTTSDVLFKSRYISVDDPNRGNYPYLLGDKGGPELDKYVDADGNVKRFDDVEYIPVDNSNMSIASITNTTNAQSKMAEQIDYRYEPKLDMALRLQNLEERLDDPVVREMWDSMSYEEFFVQSMSSPLVFKELDEYFNDRKCTKKYVDYPDIILVENLDYLHYFGDLLCKYISQMLGLDVIFCDIDYNPGLRGCHKYIGNKKVNEVYRKMNWFDYMIYRCNQELCKIEGGSHRINSFEKFINKLKPEHVIYLYEQILFHEPFPPGDYSRSEFNKIIISKLIENGTFGEVETQQTAMQKFVDDQNFEESILQSILNDMPGQIDINDLREILSVN